MSSLTLRIVKGMGWEELYSRLFLGGELSRFDKIKILKIAILLINSKNVDLEKLAYRIILRYSNRYNDYKPLFDVSINIGYFPISKSILNKLKNESDSVWELINNSIISSYERDGKYLTKEQVDVINEFERMEDESQAIIAPTSYGKSDLLINSISKNKAVCIIVPTKALLAQTKKRILQSDKYSSKRKIITHDEMFNENDCEFVAILTQERFIKLYKRFPKISFDNIYVDEAHNILNDDSRSRLLAISLMLAHSKNNNVVFKFFTPFLYEIKNLQLKYSSFKIYENKVNETLKSERIYICNFNKDSHLHLYDQFFNKRFFIEDYSEKNEINLILGKAASKNIIYFNRPVNIEKFVKDFIKELPEVHSPEIDGLIEELKTYVHEDYTLIDCIKRGVVFHHGSVPDIIKLYLEELYKENNQIRFIVTTSTLLEGVNIPAEKMFLLSNKKGLSKLSRPQFQNLIGRVCRFSEIFRANSQDLDLLEPEVFMISSPLYGKCTKNVEDFLEDCLKIDKKESDSNENILLENSKVKPENKDDIEDLERFIDHIDENIRNSKKPELAKTTFGKACYENNVRCIDILGCEEFCQELVDEMLSNSFTIKSITEFFDAIYKIFIPFIIDNRENANILRLQGDDGARSFYEMLLNWKFKNTSFNQMVNRFVFFWTKRLNEKNKRFVYVGKWGEVRKDNSGYVHWVNIEGKSKKYMNNLAIVRIKEEFDFLEHSLLNFIEVLNQLNLIDLTFYEKLKYGTTNKEEIVMIKNGISPSLVKTLLSKYKSYISININDNTIDLDKKVIDSMKSKRESFLAIFETGLNLKS